MQLEDFFLVGDPLEVWETGGQVSPGSQGYQPGHLPHSLRLRTNLARHRCPHLSIRPIISKSAISSPVSSPLPGCVSCPRGRGLHVGLDISDISVYNECLVTRTTNQSACRSASNKLVSKNFRTEAPRPPPVCWQVQLLH